MTGFKVALDERLNVFELGLIHTLVVGKSGSGKGSVLQAITRACLPYVVGGYCQLWGFDPKRAELAGRSSALYHRVGHAPEELLANLRDLHNLMLRRQGGRAFTATPEQPQVVVQIDEYTSLFDAFDRKTADEAMRLLRMLLLQGRSAGLVVVAYGQEATKEATALRDSFPQRICLRVQTAQEVDLVLGAGAVELGARAHAIPIASASNDYKSAGVAYVRTESGEMTRVRFPYTSDADLERLADTYGTTIAIEPGQVVR